MSADNAEKSGASSGPAKSTPRFAFMDATEAAAHLHTDRPTVLKYIQEGKLRTYGGRPTNPFVRSEDVEQLVQELLPDTADQSPLDPKTVHRNDPVRKLKLRIQQDAKWPEVDEAAMRAWAVELEPVSYNRMRQVAQDAIARLQKVIEVLDETEANKAKAAKPAPLQLGGLKPGSKQN